MSCVTCRMSGVMCHFFWTKWWSYLVEGLLSMGPTLSGLSKALFVHCVCFMFVINYLLNLQLISYFGPKKALTNRIKKILILQLSMYISNWEGIYNLVYITYWDYISPIGDNTFNWGYFLLVVFYLPGTIFTICNTLGAQNYYQHSRLWNLLSLLL